MISEPIYMDIEASFSGNIQELGLVYKEDKLKTSSIKEAFEYIKYAPTEYIAGPRLIHSKR